jgi:glycosyltransferase involved in cell wall biosynthesis
MCSVLPLTNVAKGDAVPSVAVLGTRGYPSYYGGFETAIRYLAPELTNMGWDVTVYGRPGSTRIDDNSVDSRVAVRETRGIETKNLSTLSYGLSSAMDSAFRKPDVALVMNVANGFFLPLLSGRGVPTLVNVDGLEWERAKWSRLAQRTFLTGAKCTARWASHLVFDSREIEAYWQRTFGAHGSFIPYGGEVPPPLPIPDGLHHRGYILVVARFVPENSIPQFFDAVPALAAHHPVVIVGSSGYGSELDERAGSLAAEHDSVTWLGHVSDDSLLLALWQHAGVYFHGHSVGGTNPALVQAMAAGAPIVARDTLYNREVLGTAGRYVSPVPHLIVEAMLQLMDDQGELDRACRENVERIEQHYSWKQVCNDYERVLRRLAGA